MNRKITNRLLKECCYFIILSILFWIFDIQDTLLESIELVIWTYIFTKLIELGIYLIEIAIKWVKKHIKFTN